MRTLCIEIVHRFVPGSGWVFIGHGQQPFDEFGNGPGIPGLLLRRDRGGRPMASSPGEERP